MLMPSTTTSGTPLQETDFYKSGLWKEWKERNERIGYAYRFLKQYEGTNPRLLELKHKITRIIARGGKQGKKEEVLTLPEIEEAYALSRGYPELPPPEPEEEKTGRKRAIPPPNYREDAKRARERGLVPISDAHRAELRRKLEQLNPGVYCEFVYLTEKNYITRKGDFVSYDEDFIILMGETGSFWKIPIEKVFHGTYDIKQQGGKLK